MCACQLTGSRFFLARVIIIFTTGIFPILFHQTERPTFQHQLANRKVPKMFLALKGKCLINVHWTDCSEHLPPEAQRLLVVKISLKRILLTSCLDWIWRNQFEEVFFQLSMIQLIQILIASISSIVWELSSFLDFFLLCSSGLLGCWKSSEKSWTQVVPLR